MINMCLLTNTISLILLFSVIAARESQDPGGGPLAVVVEETGPGWLFLSWKPPPTPPELKLFAYSLTLTPIPQGAEREFSVAPSVTKKRVSGLSAGQGYAVRLSAVFGDLSKQLHHDALIHVHAPKFTIKLPPDEDNTLMDVPVGDNGVPLGEPPCNCSEAGMVACTRSFERGVECTCRPGYDGTWCEECAPGNFRAAKECVLCPCSNLTSTADCKIGEYGQVSCSECLPGHRGNLCTACSAGYKWSEEEGLCRALDCLSDSRCVRNTDAPGCEQCRAFLPHTPATRTYRSERGIADGTLPLIAVVVTLSVLLLVAAMGTCYRYWDRRRHQPRMPFWSIELQAEDAHYQHLDTKPKAEVPVKNYNTMNV